MAETLMVETETITKQHDPFQRKIEFIPVKKPFKGFSNDFNIETLNPTTSEHRQLVSANIQSSQPQPSKNSEFSEFGLDPELSLGMTFRRIGAGLWNLGNTCFLNSVLQCLTYTEPLAAYLQSGKHKSSCHIAGFCALCAIQNHVSCALQATGRIVSPQDMVGNLRCILMSCFFNEQSRLLGFIHKYRLLPPPCFLLEVLPILLAWLLVLLDLRLGISRNFRKARQEDAHEYMVNLLESMHKCCLPSGVPSESPGAFEKSLVHKIFGGRLRSQVKCRQCSYSSNKFDPFLDLSLEILKADSLQKALANFTAAELLDGGEKQYHCQRCKQKVQAVKQLTIHKAPYVLAIHLKRFYAHDPNIKIKKKVRFDSALNLKPFVSGSSDGDVKYSLYGVLVHSGFSTHSGHYYCYVRTSNNMWYTLDDTRVSHVGEQEVLNQQAYMLFYVRDKKSITPRKPVNIAKEEISKTNVIGSRYPSTPTNALKDYPNGHVENKFCGVPLTAETQKNLLNADPSRISDALIQQKNSGILAKSLMHNETPVSERTSKELTQMNSSDELPVAKSELECLSSLDHSGKDNVSGNQKCLVAPAGDKPNLFTEDTLLKERVDSPLVEPIVSNPQTFIGKHASDRTSPSDEKNSPAEVDAVAAQDSVTNLSEHAGLVGTSNAAVPQGLVLKVSSKRSLKDSRLDQKQVKKSKKKFPKYKGSIMQLSLIRPSMRCLGPRKKNHKKNRRCLLGLKYHSKEKLKKNAISSDVGPSISRKEHLRSSLMKHDAEGEIINRMDQNCAVLATATQVENMSRCSLQDDKRDQMQNTVVSQGLEETVVARWDDVELPSSQALESKTDQIARIGYVGDEWDEEYDTGKRKKLRCLKQSFGGPNIFQEIATEKSKLKRAKLDHSSFRNHPPFRI